MEGGAALIATAITELSENLHEDAARLQRGDLTVVMVRVDALRSAAADVSILTEALAVLARHGGASPG